MTPYYEDTNSGITIYHGDCREVLPELSGVGLVLTSPPYNLNGDGFSATGTYFRALDEGYGSHHDAMPHDEYVAWQQDVLNLCWETLADDGAIFYNHKPRVRGNNVRAPFDLVPWSLPIRQIVVWDRGSGFNRQFTYFVPAHEWVLLICREAFRLNTRSVDDVWRIPFEIGGEHPAPFPLAFATRAVGSTDARTVLDPFMGSGTTLRAAKDLGRRAIGIEIEERYCEIAAKRLQQEVLPLEQPA